MAQQFPSVMILIAILTISIPLACRAEDKTVTEYQLTDFRESSAWRITTLHGKPSSSRFENGVLTCDFSRRPGYVGIGDGVGAIPGTPLEVTLSFESNTSGHPIVLRFLDSERQFFQKAIANLDADGIRTIRVPVNDMSKWFHFGGKDDGVVRPPIKLAEIIVDGDGPDTSVRLIELRVKTQIALDEGISFGIASREQGEKADTIVLEMRTILSKPVIARYSWRTSDFFGAKLDSGHERLVLEPGAALTRSLKVAKDGIRLCEFRLDADVPVEDLAGGPPKPLKPRGVDTTSIGCDAVQVTKVIPTSVVRLEHGGSAALLEDSPFGMGIYLGQRWSSAEQEQPTRIARDIGVKWMRDEFNWGHVEPEKGTWRWERFDSSVDIATRNGISIFGLLCYWAPWAKPHTEEGIRDYCNYVRAVVGRYKDRIKYWEIWNEPNIFFWTGTVEQYATLMKAAYDAVKEADPDAKVIGCCTAGTDLKFIEQVFKFGGFDKMDILSIHPYRYPPTPEESDFIGELKRCDALVRKYGAPKEIWITEIGWPTNVGGNGSSEAKQAAMIARTYMQAMASGVVQKIFWYNFRNDGLDPLYNEHNFGIIRSDHSPKPACVAFRTMTQHIEGKRFVKALDPSPGVCAYLFEGPKGRTLAAWCASGTASLVVSGGPKSIEASNLIGTRVSINAARIPISEYPVFIDGFPADVNVKVDNVKPADKTASESPINIETTPIGPSRFAVEVTAVRPLKTPVQVTVHVPGFADRYDIPAGTKARREEYDVPAGLSLDPGKGILVSVIADTGDEIVSKRSKVYYVPCWRVSNVVTDGLLDDWNLNSPIPLGQPGHTQALDPGKWTGPDDLSAHVWTAWDDSCFYIAARVKDDVFRQTSSGPDIWQGDSLQFGLDPLHLEERGLGTFYEIGLAQTPKGPQVYCWHAPEGGKPGLVQGAKLVVKREGDVTVYEAAIPLASLVPLRPEPGKTVGFALVINDDDGEGRKGWLEWNTGIAMEKNPGLFGDITFTK